MKILIVEDEKTVRTILATYLDDAGYTVVEACDGVDGLEVFARESPDLVLTDIKMPRLDGLDMMAAIKRQSPATPVVVMTGDPSLIKEALDGGAHTCLTKPIIDFDSFDETVRKALCGAV